MLTWPTKDPNEVLDYSVNWADPESPVLVTGETISSSVFTVVQGDVVIDSEGLDPSGICTVWLSGGTDGTVCQILNRITTSAGRVYDQTVKLRIKTH